MQRRARIPVAVLFLVFALGIYAFFIEPDWLEITHHKVPAPMPLITVAHLSDLHVSSIGQLENRVMESLRRLSPDLIAITGDMAGSDSSTNAVLELLAGMEAPLGVWMVDGNWDHWTLPAQGLRTIATQSNATLLRNENKMVADGLWIVGIDDSHSGSPQQQLAFRGMPKDGACIALFHSPEYFDEVKNKCFLNLAGHTHGGQVRLPFIGPLWLPPGSGKYVAGWYGGPTSQLYVNRGVGTSILNVRFMARPEIALLSIGGEK